MHDTSQRDKRREQMPVTVVGKGRARLGRTHQVDHHCMESKINGRFDFHSHDDAKPGELPSDFLHQDIVQTCREDHSDYALTLLENDRRRIRLCDRPTLLKQRVIRRAKNRACDIERFRLQARRIILAPAGWLTQYSICVVQSDHRRSRIRLGISIGMILQSERPVSLMYLVECCRRRDLEKLVIITRHHSPPK
jgi:hypothetical protein